MIFNSRKIVLGLNAVPELVCQKWYQNTKRLLDQFSIIEQPLNKVKQL